MWLPALFVPHYSLVDSAFLLCEVQENSQREVYSSTTPAQQIKWHLQP